jgi:hypothetical protein
MCNYGQARMEARLRVQVEVVAAGGGIRGQEGAPGVPGCRLSR